MCVVPEFGLPMDEIMTDKTNDSRDAHHAPMLTRGAQYMHYPRGSTHMHVRAYSYDTLQYRLQYHMHSTAQS
jgi:hypothetical protein